MDINHLDLDPWKLAYGLRDLYGYEIPEKLVYSSKHRLNNHNNIANADMELHPFEIKKGDITLMVIPYTIYDTKHNPRFVETVQAKGISVDELVEQISAIWLLEKI